MKLRLSDRAKSELRAIRTYTLENFGIRQVAVYRGALGQGFSTLRHFPSIGMVDRRLPRGHQAFKVAHHWICYEVNGEFVDVKAIVRRLDHFEHPPTD